MKLFSLNQIPLSNKLKLRRLEKMERNKKMKKASMDNNKNIWVATDEELDVDDIHIEDMQRYAVNHAMSRSTIMRKLQPLSGEFQLLR